jgi:hypothetical protein
MENLHHALLWLQGVTAVRRLSNSFGPAEQPCPVRREAERR